MISKLSRHDGSRLSATISLVLSVVLLVIGLFLTSIIFWPRPFRAWVRGPHPIKNVSLLGPMLLGIGYFGCMRLRKGGRSASGAVVRVGLGLAMIIVSSLPWLFQLAWLLKLGLPDKVPLELRQMTGMFGVVTFVFIGLPGLAVTAVGLADLWAQRCPSGSPHAEPAIAKPPRRASLLMLLIASVPGSVLMAFPVAAVYAFLISLPVPLVRGGAAAGLEGIRMSPLFVLIVVFFSGWPLLFIVGMGMCAAVAVACSRVRAQGLLMLALIALMEFIALAIWHSGLLGVVFSFFTR